MSRTRNFVIPLLLIFFALSCEQVKIKDFLNGTWAGSEVPFLYDNLDNDWSGAVKEYQYAYFGGGIEYSEDEDEVTHEEVSQEKSAQAADDQKSDQKVADAGLDPRREAYRLRHSLRYVRRTKELVKARDNTEFEAHMSFITDDKALAETAQKENWLIEAVTNKPDKKVPVEGLKEANLNVDWKLDQGVNMLNTEIMAKISSIIYLNFKTAAIAFHEMGFDEQYFIWQSTNGAQYKSWRLIPKRANLFDGQGVVLKKNPKNGQPGFIVVAFRGTEPDIKADVYTDAAAYDIRLGVFAERDKDVQVHAGFYKSMKDMFHFVREHIPSTLENRMRRELSQYKWATPEGKKKLESFGLSGDVQPPEDRQIFFTGHSLGAALAAAAYGELVLVPQVMVQIARQDLHAYSKTVNEKLAAVKGDVTKLQGQKIELPSGLVNHHYFADSTLRKLDYWQTKNLFTRLLESTVESERNVLSETHKKIWQITKTDPSLSLKMGKDDVNFPGLIRMPILEVDEVAEHPRVHSVITFGSPRSGNEMYKIALENYARKGLVNLQRVENTWRPGGNLRELLGDLVTRVPIDLQARTSKYQYSHIGYRMFYKTEEKAVHGDQSLLTCEYTRTENEARLNLPVFGDGRVSVIRDAIYNGKYHMMDLYLKRIASYLDLEGDLVSVEEKRATGDLRLEPNHTCRKLNHDAPDYYM